MTDAEWDRIKQLGLNPNIKTKEDYLTASRTAEKMLQNWVKWRLKDPEHESLLLTPSELRDAGHFLAREIHPNWNGEFRHPQQDTTKDNPHPGNVRIATIKENGRTFAIDACDWRDVPNKLEADYALAKETFFTSKPSLEDKWQAIVYQHMAIVEAQPYLDGNKRLAEAISTAQIAHVMGEGATFRLGDFTSYREALMKAIHRQQPLILNHYLRGENTALDRALEAEKIDRVIEQTNELNALKIEQEKLREKKKANSQEKD